jgi:hypothetical protein
MGAVEDGASLLARDPVVQHGGVVVDDGVGVGEDVVLDPIAAVG